jgi:hypothetical protein
VKVQRTASSGAGLGTTTRATCGRRTATTTSAFAAPELTSGSEYPHLNRSAFRALPAQTGIRQNAMAAGVLVGVSDGTLNARRSVSHRG